jgi:hypothetical protein
MTIYVPDDLAATVKKELDDANISAICQDALRAELERARARKAAAKKLGGQEFARVEASDFRFGYRDGHDVAFQGKKVGDDPDRGTSVYLTPKGALAVVGEGRNSYDEMLAIYDSYDEFAGALAPYGEAMGMNLWPYDLVAQVADALGEEAPVEELDI